MNNQQKRSPNYFSQTAKIRQEHALVFFALLRAFIYKYLTNMPVGNENKTEEPAPTMGRHRGAQANRTRPTPYPLRQGGPAVLS